MIRNSAILLIFTVSIAQAAKTGFVDHKYKNADGSESPYVVFVPHGYDGKTAVPAILFLHGAGETKGGTKMPVEVGLATHIKKHEKTFPYLVVIPQSEKRTWLADSDDGKRALAILDETAKAYKIDAKRVALSGLSMGGFGTWSLAAAHPEKWCAIVPICGGVSPSKIDDSAKKIKDLPCWCFHGDKDPAVKVEKSREMIAAIKKAGGSPKYTEYPGVDHNSWDKAYATEEMWTWLAKQTK